jgi:protocatechuate 3,4-dioxygenase beta subunit
VQQKGIQPEMNLRGVFTSDKDGKYAMRSVYPRYYPIPFDGTVGKMLQALDRNHNRPAHLHFIITAPGYEKVITHIFTPDCPWLKDDAVFAVKESLIADFKMMDDPKKAASLGMPNPFRICEWNIVLTKEKK